MMEKKKLGHRIGIGFGALIGITLVLGTIALTSLAIVKDESDDLTREYVPSFVELSEFRQDLANLMLSTRSYALSRDKAFLKDIDANLGTSLKSLAEVEDLVERSSHLKAMNADLKKLRSEYEGYVALVKETNAAIDVMATRQAALVVAAEQLLKPLESFMSQQRERLKSSLRGGGKGDSEQQFLRFHLADEINRTLFVVRITGQRAQVEDNPKMLEEKMPLFERILSLYDQLERELQGTEQAQAMKSSHDGAIAYQKSLQDMLVAWKNLAELSTKRGASRAVLLETMEKISAACTRETAGSAETTARTVTVSNYVLMFGIASALILGILMALAITRAITRPIRALVDRLRNASDETASASEQLSVASQRLAESSTEQASSLQEAASTLEELNAMTHKSAENADKSSELAGRSQSSAQQGKASMEEVLQAMVTIERSTVEIMEAVEESNQRISQIVDIIGDIGNRTKVINEIVFQTKLLSFNASVEAARAGEHGKGFAVVAEEVGNLAQMSGNAANEIEGLLAGSVARVESIVSETKSRIEGLVSQGKVRVEEGKRLVERCDLALADLVKGATQSAQLANEVSMASDQQSQGINELTAAMSQLDQATQGNAATAEESASSAERLSQQALELRSAIQSLVCLVEGGNDALETSNVTRLALPRSAKAEALACMPPLRRAI